MKKPRTPKKSTFVVRQAEFNLNHAVVRGESNEVLKKLSKELAEAKRKSNE